MHLCTYTSHRLRCYLHTSLFCSWLYPRSQHGWLNPWSTAGTCLQDRIQDIPLANPLGKSPWNHDIPSDKILMYWNHGFSHGKPMVSQDRPTKPWDFSGFFRFSKAYFWRNDKGELELGVFDWGGMGCRSLGFLVIPGDGEVVGWVETKTTYNPYIIPISSIYNPYIIHKDELVWKWRMLLQTDVGDFLYIFPDIQRQLKFLDIFLWDIFLVKNWCQKPWEFGVPHEFWHRWITWFFWFKHVVYPLVI